jgi:hypothetical protein
VPENSEKKYLQSLLENLISSYETEINYTPIEIELDPKQITPEDINSLMEFINKTRKRLFIFKIPDDESTSTELSLVARRSVLNKTAETILQNTSSDPKIYPLKKTLGTNSSSVRARIQIQKSFVLPKAPVSPQETHRKLAEKVVTPDIILIPINLPELPKLMKQLAVLGIENLNDVAELKIKEHLYAFKDGIIPDNLPKGFYIDHNKKALCYTNTPRKLPSSLAPVLQKQEQLVLPSIEQIKKTLLQELPENTINQLMEPKYSAAQRNTLLAQLPEHSSEIKALLHLLKPTDTAVNHAEFVIPFLCKQFILGGKAHTVLLVRLLNACLNKNISLEFLKNSEVQNSLLSTRGIKNLQKLVRLPAEQKDWWNRLVIAHLNYDKGSFDFNTFFEAYTQIFLTRIAEKNLTLPNPCPIEHNGHLLITLNRVLDVIEQAENPQEQCLSLSHLNWGSTGVHYAMKQTLDLEKFKQVASCMKLDNPEDTVTDPELIYRKIEPEDLDLTPWLFRYMGQHWKAEIRLSDIHSQLQEIEKLGAWTKVQKNQLTFILTCTFADKTTLNSEQWKKTLHSSIHLLQQLDETERSNLLQAISRCFKFKPNPSFVQINSLIKQCIDLKAAFPTQNFKDELITPLTSCLENEGAKLLSTLQERIQKTDPKPEENLYSLSVIASFTKILQNNRHLLSPNLNKLLAKLNEPDLTQISVEQLLEALKDVQIKKGEHFYQTVLSTLSQINISKSQSLPKIEQVITLIDTLANAPETIPEEYKTAEQQEAWLKDLIITKSLLPDCVLGNGDISKLDDLIVDALVDAIKKRSAVFRIDTLKAILQKHLQNYIVPQQLRDQLNEELIPLFDAVNELVTLLQTPSPKFPDVIEKLKYFEEKKPILLEATYGVSILGKTKGEYILSFLLTGKRKASDNTTGAAFASVLSQLHGLFISEMKAFFENPQNKSRVKDLDLNTCLAWMAAFNATQSLTFFFKEELVEKKVLPALKKTLQQLNTQDPEFEKSILEEASKLTEDEPSDQSLQQYKNKIEAIANYLNLLIQINNRQPEQFNKIYKQLNKGPLSRLNYEQKQVLINKLISDKPEELDRYLKLTTQALEENPNANEVAIERAIQGLIELFKLSDLEPETQVMFFKMSMTHNLKSSSPFPLSALNELKKSPLPEATKSLIIKQIIQILIGISNSGSPELIQGLIQQTQLFLTQNQSQAELCIALLKRVSQENPNQDLNAYSLTLQQLTQINQTNRGKIAKIIMGLANSKKDDTVNLFALLEVIKGLGRRSSDDIDKVLKLFATLPYPNTQSLNSALLAHDSDKLSAYCLNFDTNPFAKAGEKRNFAKHFATDRVKDALLNLQDLIHEVDLPHSLQLKLAKQLNFIETLGYTDPLNPNDFKNLKKLTACSRHDLQQRASTLLQQLRSKSVALDDIEVTQLELLAYLREIYFRTTGLFPNTTQMLVLLLGLHDPSSNLLMRIKTGEGKSINTPMLSVLQWTQGGTVDQCTANPTLLLRDYENSCEPFFKFLGIKSALIQSDTDPEAYQLDGINCSTVEDMSIFRLAAKEAKKERYLENGGPIHVVLDECDDALLDQVTLYKLVAETDSAATAENNPAQWIFPLAYQFIKLPGFRNVDPALGKVWDEDEDLEQLRLFLNKEVNEKFNGNVEKQNYLLAASNTQLKQWIHASCVAANLVENKHFIVKPIKEKDDTGQEVTKKIICIPLIRSTPKTGSIFTEAVQQALQARLQAERTEQAQYIFIDTVPSVLASQSARGLIRFYQNTKGRLVGISATPGDNRELESLATALGIQAISVAPYAGDKRKNHAPIFTADRAETIKAIHTTLDNIKCPITKPTLEINPDIAIQTYEDRESLLTQTESAIEKWSHSQTQPILIINEDFDEAQVLGASLESYKKQGFKIQIVTGKESPDELDRIIKQAGKVNTITVSTAMFAKGIDINPGDHPRGLFVIQTYPDTERMTTQIAGRAARNGKPGEWLPIYQTQRPQSLIDLFTYYFFPWRRQQINERTIESLKNRIKLQATIDRLYTQAVDEIQQVLMQQIEAWESLLLELYPFDPKIQFEFYQWRESLLGELSRSQETSVSEISLEANIAHFKNVACKLWESAREEKWATKAQKAIHISTEQNIRLRYLKQLDLDQELTIQMSLQEKRKPFLAATKALMHQNLETVIMDKAGAVLDYAKPSGQTKVDLELAQSKQILPNLIAEFCTNNPEAIKTLFPSTSQKNSSYLPEIISSVINKFIAKKSKVLHQDEKQEIAESIIQHFQNNLIKADSKKIQELLLQLKPLIINYCEDLRSLPLVEQFKMQGIVLTFSTLYQNARLPEDSRLSALKTSYNEEVMKELAKHLIEEFAWVKEKPQRLHAFFERTVAKTAAHTLYSLATDLLSTPQDQDKIRALYTGLQEQKAILKDKYLFSIRHSSPRNVINDALNAIDSLNSTPYCEPEFRNQCHDNVISEHQLSSFRNSLSTTSPYFFKTEDPIWDHLKDSLLKISNQSKNNQSHVLQELYEAAERFSTYEVYKPYLRQIKGLKKQLLQSIKELHKEDGLTQDTHESLLAAKTKQFATLLKIDPKQIRLQRGSDGIKSFIDLQIEDAPLIEQFTRYQSAFLTQIESEKNELIKIKTSFAEHKEELFNLSDISAIESIPLAKREGFEKLFRLKELLSQDWNSNSETDRSELPESMQTALQHIDEIKQWDWTKQDVDLQQLKIHLGKEPEPSFIALIDQQAEIIRNRVDIQSRIQNAEASILKLNEQIKEIEGNIETAEVRRKKSDCNLIERASLWGQIQYNHNRISSSRTQLIEPTQLLSDNQEEERECLVELREQNQLIDAARKELISSRLTEIQHELASYLSTTSKQLVLDIAKELEATDPVIDKIQKAEIKKSHYQTRRFFKTSELLRYEATLLGEEAQRPTAPTPELNESEHPDALKQEPIIDSLSFSS